MANLITRHPPELPAPRTPPPENIWIDAYLDEKQSELLKHLRVMIKRKWLALAVAALVFGLAAVRTMRTPRVYASSVNIQIDPEQSVLPYKDAYATVVPDSTYLGTQ